MIITLSEERKEKLLCEWSGEITDEHAQDFCYVCNEVFSVNFDLDYMHRKYDANCYGKSFIVVAYKDEKPVAVWGVWRNDVDGRTAFQLCDFASVPSARKGGYIVDMLYCIYDELNRHCPGSLIYGFPNNTSYPVMKAAGWSTADMYMRIFCGALPDFLDSMPFIDDAYVEQYMSRKKNVGIIEVKGRCYLVSVFRMKRIIPSAQFLGEVSSSYRSAFRRVSRARLLLYRSAKPGILGKMRAGRVVAYDLAASKQVMNTIPPQFRADGCSLDFNAAPLATEHESVN